MKKTSSPSVPAPVVGALFAALVYRRDRTAKFHDFTYDPRLDTLIYQGRLFDLAVPDDVAAFEAAQERVFPNHRCNVEGRTNRLRVRIVTGAELAEAEERLSRPPAPPEPVVEDVPPPPPAPESAPVAPVAIPAPGEDDPFARASRELYPAGVAMPQAPPPPVLEDVTQVTQPVESPTPPAEPPKKRVRAKAA